MKPVNGPHLAFPFRVAENGRPAAVATLEGHIRDELVQLLLTNPGERAFLPEFGGGVRRLVFESSDETTAAMARAVITQAVSTWLGHRVILENLVVAVESATITVDLRYRISGTEDVRLLRFQRKGG